MSESLMAAARIIAQLEDERYRLRAQLKVCREALEKLADEDHMINDCGNLKHSTHCVNCFAKHALSQLEGEK